VQDTLEFSQAFSWRLFSYRLAQLFLLYGIILLPTGAGHMNDVLILSAAFSLLSGQVYQKWAMIRDQKLTFWTFVFSLLILISVFYTQGSWKYAWQGFIKYEKILFFMVFFPLFLEKSFRDLALNSFIISAFLSVLIILSGYVQPEPLINAIDSAFIVSVASFLVLRKALDGGPWRWLSILLFIFLGSYLLLFNVERTGYLLFFAGVGIAFWQRFSWRGLWIGFGVILSFLIAFYYLNSTFSHRLSEGYQEANRYLSADARTSRAIGEALGLISFAYKEPEIEQYRGLSFPSFYKTYRSKHGLRSEDQWFLHPHADIRLSSIGLRLGFIKYSWREIKKHPWLGNGNGSFRDVYWAGGGPTIADDYLGHPHNEYVLIVFQFGFLGLLIFLFWQLCIWTESFRLPQAEQCYLQGLVLCFALLGLCNASLFVNPSGVVFVILYTIFLASKPYQRGRPWTSP
jgi:hypothetical protein